MIQKTIIFFKKKIINNKICFIQKKSVNLQADFFIRYGREKLNEIKYISSYE